MLCRLLRYFNYNVYNMKKITRAVTRGAYTFIAKPILFRFKPDTVHEQMVRTAVITQKLGFINPLLHVAWAHNDEKILGQTVFGIRFENSLGLSAGFDKNANLPITMRAVGFGFATVGSITANAAPGNPKPWYHRLPDTKSLVVNAGLPNEGADVISGRIEQYASKNFDSFHLVASVAKTNSPETATDEAGVEDYVEGLNKLKNNPRIAIFEINVSCPNTFGGEPFTRPKPLDDLLTRIDALELLQPVVIKMPISLEWSEFEKLLEIIVRHRVHGVTIGNLQKNRTHVDLKDPLPDSIRGNLSGRACFEDSNELIRKTYKKYGEKLTIIGVGGVFSAEDAYEKIKSGASLVEMITGVIFNGPQIVGDINHGLAKLLKADGYKNITEAIGANFK